MWASPTNTTVRKLSNRKIRPGTRNLAREPAMTRQETAQAIWTGMELARRAKAEGVAVLGVGEMGIGNTTTSAAVLAALTGLLCGDGYGPGRRHDRCGLPAEKAGHYPGLSPA
ncbi:MAG: nicotinate-nucleotide--dimethylbenzimidazole phosphoribosyltransferase [Oscillospiraceae bacterium]